MIKIPTKEYKNSDIPDDESLSPITLPNKRIKNKKSRPLLVDLNSSDPNGKPEKRQKRNECNSKNLSNIETKENKDYSENEGNFNTPDFKVNNKKKHREKRVRKTRFPDILIKEFSYLDSPGSNILYYSQSK